LGRDSVRVDLDAFPRSHSRPGSCARCRRFKIKFICHIPQTQTRHSSVHCGRKASPRLFRHSDSNHVSLLIERMAGSYRADCSPHQSPLATNCSRLR
jgi:hypothetical protein